MEFKIFLTKQKHLKRWERGWFRSWYRIRIGRLVIEARGITLDVELPPIKEWDFSMALILAVHRKLITIEEVNQ